MRMWQVAILVNLALAVGLGFGYGAWGRRLATLDGEVKTSQAQVAQLTREREACFAGARYGEQLWEGRGIVRAVYPRVLIVTHEEIPGLLPARTTGFRLVNVWGCGPSTEGFAATPSAARAPISNWPLPKIEQD